MSVNVINIGRCLRSAVFAALVWALLPLAAVGKKGDVSKILPKGGQLIEDVVYKQTAVGPLRLDIYRPDAASTVRRPVVVFIHGGSWIHGSKDGASKGFIAWLTHTMLRDGYVVVSVDYRLCNDSMTVCWPDPLADCKDAVRWVRAHAAELGIDPARVAVMGDSAGGHLAMLTGYAPDDVAGLPDDGGENTAGVKCVVDIYGPTDLSPLLKAGFVRPAVGFAGLVMSKAVLRERDLLLWAFTGQSSAHPRKRQKICRYYSPLYYADRAVPTLILHGNKDKLVPFNHSQKLMDRFDRLGKAYDLQVLDGLDHCFRGISKEQLTEMTGLLSQFLHKHL